MRRVSWQRVRSYRWSVVVLGWLLVFPGASAPSFASGLAVAIAVLLVERQLAPLLPKGRRVLRALLPLLATAVAYQVPQSGDVVQDRRAHAALTALLVTAYLSSRRSGPPVRGTAVPPDLAQAYGQACAHLERGEPGLALPLLREALDHPQLSGAARGQVAALLGWTLLYEDADDPVPDEARRALAVAVDTAPAHPMAVLLRAYFHVHDREPAAALATAEPALTTAEALSHKAQLLSIIAVARHQRGDGAQARTCREAAQHLWPACDLLPWVDAQLAHPLGGR